MLPYLRHLQDGMLMPFQMGHEHLPESGITRLLEHLKRNATMIANIIASDLAAVFPEYNHTFEIDSKVSLRILETYSIPEEIISADAMPYNNSYTASGNSMYMILRKI